MKKNLLFVLVLIIGLLYFFTDNGKEIEDFFTSLRSSVEKTDKISPPSGKIIERNVEDFFPLREGKVWRYTTTHSTKGKGTLSITNLAQQELKERRAYPRKYEFSNGRVSMTYIIYIAKEDSDIYQFAKGASLDVLPYQYDPIDLLKEPIQVGAIWKRRNTTGVIEGVDEEITVPAGTFKGCVKVKTTFASGSQTTQWLAPEIGGVKIYHKYPDKSNSEFLLESYK